VLTQHRSSPVRPILSVSIDLDAQSGSAQAVD
jgi:hypothetical protein